MFLLVAVCVFCTSSAKAEEIIQNISLYSSANNQTQSATLKVKTVVNGKVVEDYEESSNTGSVNYNSKINRDSPVETTVVSKSASDLATFNTLADLLALLQRLTELLNKNSLEK